MFLRLLWLGVFGMRRDEGVRRTLFQQIESETGATPFLPATESCLGAFDEILVA